MNFQQADKINDHVQNRRDPPFIVVQTAEPILGGIRFRCRVAPNPWFPEKIGLRIANPDQIVEAVVEMSDTLLRHHGLL